MKVLLIGYGNPGRLDDGLGPALAERVEKLAGSSLTVESNYQLTVEDAALLAKHDVVILADADIKGPEGFHFSEIQPVHESSFTTHSVRPEALLGMAHNLFNSNVKGYILGIRGYEFDDFGEHLSSKALSNLDAAETFLRELLISKEFDKATREFGK